MTSTKVHLVSFPWLIHQYLGLQLRIVRQECLKQFDGVLDIIGAARLPDGVHAELGVSEVERPDAHLGREHGADGTAAGTVVPDHEQLERDAGLLGHFLEEDDAWRVCSVALIGIN